MNKPLIGILSGTFDPIHLGHLFLATKIYRLCNFKKIIFIPNYQSPLRSPPIASAQDRLNLIQLATQELPYCEVDDYELQHPPPSYTSNTLTYLLKEYAAYHLGLIMGEDVFNRLDQWYQWEKILRTTHLVVTNRSDQFLIDNPKVLDLLALRKVSNSKLLQKKPAGLIYYAKINPLPIAATKVRDLIKQGEDPKTLLHPKVWQYIYDKKIYHN